MLAASVPPLEPCPDPSSSLVSIVDDEADTCAATARLIRLRGFKTSCFASGVEFLAQYDEMQPGCLVLDLQMPGMSGVEVQHAVNLKAARPPIIFVTGHGDIPFATQAIREGAFDVITKPFQAESFLTRVHEALQLDLVNRQKWAECTETRERFGRLTHREREITELLALGDSCKQIGRKLSISSKTVDNHRAVILEKMGVDNPTQLARQLERIAENRSGTIAEFAWNTIAADAIRPCDTH